MIHTDMTMGPLDGRDWANLVALFNDRPKGRPGRGALLLLHRDGQVLKALHTRRGVLRGVRPDIVDLEQAAREHEADLVVCLTPEDLAAVFAAADSTLNPDADYVEQIMTMLRECSLVVRSNVRFWPRSPVHLRHIPYKRVRWIFNWLWPDTSSLGLFVIEDHGAGIHASLLLTKDGGQLVELTNSEALQLEGTEMRCFADTRAAIERALSARPNPMWCCLFIERSAFKLLLTGRRPLGLLRSLRRSGKAAFAPYPFKLRVLLGLGRMAGK